MNRTSRRLLAAAAVLLALPAALAAQAQQQAAPPTVLPPVGSIAPEFTLAGATREGVRAQPIKLSDYKGRTVVIAFFPAARTKGCTVQMETYRDQYAQLFRDGKDVVVIGVSADADTTLASWAKDANFPMLFASDPEGTMAAAYGSKRPTGKYFARNLYVVGKDGKIAHAMTPFNVMSQDAYAELGKAVEAAAAAK